MSCPRPALTAGGSSTRMSLLPPPPPSSFSSSSSPFSTGSCSSCGRLSRPSFSALPLLAAALLLAEVPVTVSVLAAVVPKDGDSSVREAAAALSEEILDLDDECTGDDTEACSINAMQLRANRRSASLAQAASSGEQRDNDQANAEQKASDEARADGKFPSFCWPPESCPSSWAGHPPAPPPAPPSYYSGGGGDSWWNTNSWAPAPSPPEKKPSQATGLCAVLPWLCPEPTPEPAPAAPAPPPYMPGGSSSNIPAPAPSSGGMAPGASTAPPTWTEALQRPSNAPLHTFYIYRVQNDQNYPQPNHDMLNIAGGLWYLHNEIIWHSEGRSGTYFSHPVTRLIKFKIQTRATQPLADMGMNFGVFNAFDSGECTGPFQCDNFQKVGYVVGCETWEAGSGSNFPHSQWNNLNHYKGAIWYSLPGPCPQQPYKTKTELCSLTFPGGLCPPGMTPTGQYNCTYQLEQLGELSIDEIVGIAPNYNAFVAAGGREYDPQTDKGVRLSFWDGRADEDKCAWRVKHTEMLFKQKYPQHPDLPQPPCDFNKFTFYPGRHV